VDHAFRWIVLSGGSYFQVDHAFKWIILSGGSYFQVDHAFRWIILSGGSYFQVDHTFIKFYNISHQRSTYKVKYSTSKKEISYKQCITKLTWNSMRKHKNNRLLEMGSAKIKIQ